MRLLDRYLFRELLTPLAFCLGGFMIFWTSFNLFNDLDKLQTAKLHLVDILEYSVAMMPEFLVTALPVALLLALLHTLTQHARHNELTAMRAAGLSLWRICAPYFVVGIFAGVALFVLNEYLVPRGGDWADRILNRYAPRTTVTNTKQPPGFQNERAHRIWAFTRYDFRAGELDDVRVVDLEHGRRWVAERAVFTNRSWTFFNVTEYIPRYTGDPAPTLVTNVLSMPEFTETPREMKIELKISDYERMNAKKKMVPLKDIFNYLWLRPGVKSAWLQTQLHQHLAAPFTCLVVVLIAIPFSAASGRRNLFFGVAGSIFICFFYFAIQQLCFAAGAGGHLPGWLAAWLPNLAFATVGIVLTLRVR